MGRKNAVSRSDRSRQRRRFRGFACFACGLVFCVAGIQARGVERSAPAHKLWSPPVSTNLKSHFEHVNGHKVWFVDGLPFIALGAETEWDKTIYPHYDKTNDVYDYTFAAAAAMHMNMLKVPVKWSQVEPEEGKFDFSYPDHVRKMAEKYHLKVVFDWFGHYASGYGTLYSNRAGLMYAPAWVIDNPKRFPRAVDGDGVVHNDAASYDYPAIIRAESKAFAAFMAHIRKIDAHTHTIIGIQVENEVSVFGGHERKNPRYWRDHSPASNRRFKAHGFTDDLRFSAWDYSKHWLHDVMTAGAKADKLPFFMNFVGGELEPGIVGGSPGEDVATYLHNLPHLTFIGLNNYVGDPATYSVKDFIKTLGRYKVGRNIPTVTETNSGLSQVAERSLFLSAGDFGSQLFTPWSLIISVPQRNRPYVLPDGELANGAFALGNVYALFRRALPAISYFGGTKDAAVFMANLPGHVFSESKRLGRITVRVSGSDNGKAMVIQPNPDEMILVGYHCTVSLSSSHADWPGLKGLDIVEGRWKGKRWTTQGKPIAEDPNPENPSLVRIYMPQAEVVRVSW